MYVLTYLSNVFSILYYYEIQSNVRKMTNLNMMKKEFHSKTRTFNTLNEPIRSSYSLFNFVLFLDNKSNYTYNQVNNNFSRRSIRDIKFQYLTIFSSTLLMKSIQQKIYLHEI